MADKDNGNKEQNTHGHSGPPSGAPGLRPEHHSSVFPERVHEAKVQWQCGQEVLWEVPCLSRRLRHCQLSGISCNFLQVVQGVWSSEREWGVYHGKTRGQP